MGAKGWIIFASVTVVILGGLIYLSGQGKIDVSGFNKDAIITANEKNGNIGDNFLGNKDGKVILIEYGDFQCPGCGGAHPRVKALTQQYGNEGLVFIFRNLPLTSMHPNARVAAAVAEAAGLQGKYWEMHDKLYENQKEWSGASSTDRGGIFRSYAAALGLDLDTFDTDIASSAITQKISFDQALFKATGHKQSTPTFIMDGELVPDTAWGSDAAFDTFIRDKLTAAGVKLSDETIKTE